MLWKCVCYDNNDVYIVCCYWLTLRCTSFRGDGRAMCFCVYAHRVQVQIGWWAHVSKLCTRTDGVRVTRWVRWCAPAVSWDAASWRGRRKGMRTARSAGRGTGKKIPVLAFGRRGSVQRMFYYYVVRVRWDRRRRAGRTRTLSPTAVATAVSGWISLCWIFFPLLALPLSSPPTTTTPSPPPPLPRRARRRARCKADRMTLPRAMHTAIFSRLQPPPVHEPPPYGVYLNTAAHSLSLFFSLSYSPTCSTAVCITLFTIYIRLNVTYTDVMDAFIINMCDLQWCFAKKNRKYALKHCKILVLF